MKKITKILIIVVAAVVVAAAALTTVLIVAGGNKTVEITFETNGGSAIESVEVKKNSEYVLPADAQREGYSFEGWYDNAGLSGNAVEKITVTENITFYAKWEELYPVYLNADGGAGIPSLVYLKEGANVKESLEGYVPAKTGLVFGAWFEGDRELGSNRRMTANELRLTAKYKVEYTVRMFEQNLENDGYTEVTPSATGFAYVGETYVPEISRTGFDVADNSSNVTSLLLDADKTRNVYVYYLNRKTFYVHFFGNYAGAETLDPIEAKFGENIEIPYDVFQREGYNLKGWASTTDGALVYESNRLELLSRNVTDAEEPHESITVTATVNLYAVWEQAYTNMFGGNDCLFVPDTAGSVAYLLRGGVYFKGTYDDYNKEASFRNESKLIFICRINSDHTYAYSDSSRAELEYFLYSGGSQLDKKTSVKFDEYNGIIFIENRSAENEQRSVGTYLKKGEDYEVTFTYGPRDGETMFIRLSSVNLSGSSDARVFRIRNDEEMNLGKISRCIVYAGAERPDLYGLLVSYSSAYELTLSGFGTAQMNTPDGNVNYFYEKDGDKLTLTNSLTSAVSVVKLIHPNSSANYGYIDYNEELDGEFKTSDETESLKLDGMYSGTYTDAQNEEHTAFYTITSSVFGGYVATLHLSGGDRSFVIVKNEKSEGGELIDEEDNTETAVTYELQVKSKGYAEYYFRYKDPDSGVVGTYIAPVLILNDTEEGVAGFYGLQEDTSERIYIRMAHGNYSEIKDYQYEITGIEKDNDTERYGMFDIYTLKSAVFSFENYLGLNSYYFISAKNKEGGDIGGFSATYTNGNDSIILSSGDFYIAYLGENKYHGTFEQENGIVKASAVILDSVEDLCFRLNEAEGTFTKLETAPYNVYLINENGRDYDRNTYIAFSGEKSGEHFVASYYVNGVKKYDGVVEETGRTTGFDNTVYVYKFTSEEYSFEYIRLFHGLTSLCSPYNETYNGLYQSEAGQLALDGYGYKAEFTDNYGAVFAGRYYIEEENVVLLNYDGGSFCFDLDGKAFTKRGTEYGTYALTDNNSLSGLMVTLDGYKNVKVFSFNEENGEKIYIAEDGTYTIGEDGLITINYTTEGGGATYVGKFGIFRYTIGDASYGEITRLYGEVVMSYVNDDDWTVLVLSDNGSATLYDSKGNVQNGSYVLITDDLLYFEDMNDVENGYVLNYYVSDGTIVPIKNTSRGYYTEELDSLIFSKAGFAVFNHEERFYYTVEDNKITLYKKAAGDENASRYGFVEEDFGEFGDEKVYNGKTYLSNNGYSIHFQREDKAEDKTEDGKFKFLIPVAKSETEIVKEEVTEISFAPTGAKNFEGIEGRAKIGSNEYTCYVYRETDEETDETVIYARINDFYIYLEDVHFKGVDTVGESLSTFRVKGLKRITSYNAYKFIDGYYRIYVSQGPAAARSYVQNDLYGILSMAYEYDENGDVVNSYVDADFRELTGLYDYEGNILKIEHETYEYNQNNGLYRITVESGGYVYRLYFRLEVHNVVRATGYFVYAYTREETIETADGEYRVTVERYIASDNESRVLGSFMQVGLAVKTEETGDNGESVYETVKLAGGITNSGRTYFVSRTFEQVDKKDDNGETVLDDDDNPVKTDGKLLSSTYYSVDFTENENTSLENENKVNTYKAVSVTPIEMNVYASEDGKSYVEIFDDGRIIVLNYNGNNYFVENYDYNEATKTYSVTTTDGGQYTIKLGENGEPAVFTHEGEDEKNAADKG
ncbi:MAG: InlB B-repeat-containing protein [Clostridia bacterium]|nr:InlB B-repeat-containing protein [Clostridia bacterium]